MSRPGAPKPARPFANFFFTDREALDETLRLLDDFLGERTFESTVGVFDISNYYAPEMGGDVHRMFVAWKKLIDPSEIVDIKLKSWEIENRFRSTAGGRTVNIDPGLIEEAKIVLATGKTSPHRPYMGRGVYLDITLMYENKTYRPMPWTYPDYASGQIIAMMNHLRADYMHDRNLVYPPAEKGDLAI